MNGPLVESDTPSAMPAEPWAQALPASLRKLDIARLPAQFRKANAALHIYPVQGSYSLVMRRAFNALLVLTHEALRRLGPDAVQRAVAESRVLRFEAHAADLMRLMGRGKSNNFQDLYDALYALKHMDVVWGVSSEQGRLWTKEATLLSQYEHDKGELVAWMWLPDVLGLLFGEDSLYTPLDWALLLQFRSSYTVALFENVWRYRNLGGTPRWTPDEWIRLIAGPNRYAEYRVFKNMVLKPALAELNELADSPMRLALEEQRGARAKVVGVRFVITNNAINAKSTVGVATARATPSALALRIEALGVAKHRVARLLTEHEPAYLERQAALTEKEARQRLRAGQPLKNVAGFFIRAVEQGYEKAEPAPTPLASPFPVSLPPLPADLAARDQANTAVAWFEQQPESEQQRLMAVCLATQPAAVRASHARHGIKGPLVRAALAAWLQAQGLC